MRTGALAPYEGALRGTGPLGLRSTAGEFIALDVARWLSAADDADRTVLDRCSGPVLDIGCGPGRFVSALTGRGIAALGVDIAAAAVALTRGQGLPALLRDVFASLPGEGRWPTVLLMDGNIGIGGDPDRLLTRIRALLGVGGRLIVETHPDPTAHDLLEVRFCVGGIDVGPRFDWAHVGAVPLVDYAFAAGYSPGDSWCSGGRSFVTLVG